MSDLNDLFHLLQTTRYDEISNSESKVQNWIYADGEKYALTPLSAERNELPAGSLISEKQAKTIGYGYAFGFDQHSRLVCSWVRMDGELISESFIDYSKEGLAIEFRFNEQRELVCLIRGIIENKRLIQTERIHQNNNYRREQYDYDDQKRLVKIAITTGTRDNPNKVKMTETVHYDDRGEPSKIVQVWSNGNGGTIYLSPEAEKQDKEEKKNRKKKKKDSQQDFSSLSLPELEAKYSKLLEEKLFDLVTDIDFSYPLAAFAMAYDPGLAFSGPFLGVLDKNELKKMSETFTDPLDIWNPAEWDLYDDEPLIVASKKLQSLSEQLRASGSNEQVILHSIATNLRKRLSKELETTKTFVVYATDLVQANLREDMVASNPPLVLTALAKKKLWFDK
jgi:hypothetical protein